MSLVSMTRSRGREISCVADEFESQFPCRHETAWISENRSVYLITMQEAPRLLVGQRSLVTATTLSHVPVGF